MKFSIALCLLVFAIAVTADKRWQKYLSKYEKQFKNDNKLIDHKKNFYKTEERIQKFQALKAKFEVGHNELSDLSAKSLKRRRGRLPRKLSMMGYGEPFPANLVAVVPKASVDYRTVANRLNRIRQQGDCGSCYAFGATGAIEAQLRKALGTIFEVSKQQIVDCDRSNGGCDGGLEYRVYKYIMANGIAKESAYPYRASVGACKYKSSMASVRLKDYKNHLRLTDKQTKQILNAIGPVSIGINASDDIFSSYSGGIYSNTDVIRDELDHSVLLVGYVDNVEEPYWIIKNSWGATWGEYGYGYIAQGEGDIGVTLDINYPIIKV